MLRMYSEQSNALFFSKTDTEKNGLVHRGEVYNIQLRHVVKCLGIPLKTNPLFITTNDFYLQYNLRTCVYILITSLFSLLFASFYVICKTYYVKSQESDNLKMFLCFSIH